MCIDQKRMRAWLACVVVSCAGFAARVLAADPPPSPCGTNCPPGSEGTNTIPPAYSVPGLKLYQPRIEGTNLYLTIAEGQTNGVCDLFTIGALATNGVWTYLLRSAAGQTNLVLVLPITTSGYYYLGTMQDSDGDGLTDAYEKLVSRTNAQWWDTDNDGIGDSVEVQFGLNPLVADPAFEVALTQPASFGSLP